jgi:hypothetical protein
MPYKQIVLSESKDIVSDIIKPISQRNQIDAFVYFQRYIGFNNENEYIALIDSLNEKLSAFGDAYLVFNEKIGVMFEKEEIDKIETALNISDIYSLNDNEVLNMLGSRTFLFLSRNNELNEKTRKAFEIAVNLYKANDSAKNSNIYINFIIKLICWMNHYVPALFEKQIDCNPKITYYGSVKKHEAYFLILLSLCGCDVLIFNAGGDGDYSFVDKSNQYSKAIIGNIKKDLKHYPNKIENKGTKPIAANPQAVQSNQNIRTQLNYQNNQNSRVNANSQNSMIRQIDFEHLETLVILLKKSTDIISEFALPLTQRVGYCGKPTPIIPTFFYRYVGVQANTGEAKDDYFNTLYLLDKKLKNNKNGYVKIEDHLIIPSTNELFALQDIEVKSEIINEGYINNLVFNISKSKKFFKSGDPVLDNTIIKALNTMFLLYIANEKTINASKLKNFVYKIVIWLNKYVRDLYKNTEFIETPKLLYYGEMKAHEVYFLIFLSLIGCDVLYITPDAALDNIISLIDTDETFSYLYQNNESILLEAFPANERVVRQSTVAYDASQLLEDIIYNPDTGLFKPWQFENYKTRQVTLKTTFDEFKMLWKEPSKLRTGFKVENSTIYIPNLFAKINGVNENINEYWTSFLELCSIKNCLTYKDMPFTIINYTNQELYSLAYLFDKNGVLNKDMVVKSKLYKFNYLKNSLQLHILNKIDELMLSTCFLRPIDEKFKLKILMTILTLDTKVLYLLETFDFASDVPKLFIYHNKPDQFSDEDAIVIGFLNIMGLDIVIFTPTNYNNIENHFRPDQFDTFQLPSVSIHLEIPDLSHFVLQNGNKRSLFSKIFNK